MKNISYFVILSALVWVVGCKGKFVKFEPLQMKEGVQNELVVAPELSTPDFWKRLRIVLDFYREKYQISGDGSILVTERLASNKELIWNYTTKARDDDFIAKTKAGG